MKRIKFPHLAPN